MFTWIFSKLEGHRFILNEKNKKFATTEFPS